MKSDRTKSTMMLEVQPDYGTITLERPKLRICHLAKYYPPHPGGIETHVQTLARAQASLGAEVSVLCVNGYDNHGRAANRTKTVQERDETVNVTRIGRMSSIARFDICPEFLERFFQIADESYDVIHLHTPNPTMLVAWLMAWFGTWVKGKPQIPLVITHHSDIIKQRILKYAIRLLEFLAYKQARSVITTSESYIEGSKFLRSFSHIKSLPLGLDCDIYQHPSHLAISYASKFRADYGETIWLAVGRLVYYKAIHVAIKALALVTGKLIIIGVGHLEPELKALVKELNLEDRVVWMGKASTEQLVGAYHAATALWFPSNARSEGFGLVQVEAMASGCPVINADIPCSGVTWVSRNEQEGLTVPLNDHVALAAAAQRILDEPGLRDRLVTSSNQRLFEFDHMTMAKRSFEIYEESFGSLQPKIK